MSYEHLTDPINNHILHLPRSMTLAGLQWFAIELENAPEAMKYTFDFGATRWLPPFAMLYISARIRRFRAAHPDATLVAINHTHQGYAGHMGFFTSFGLNFGNAMGEASGGSTHVPITSLATVDIRATAERGGTSVVDAVDTHSRRLAEVLLQTDKGETLETLSYSMREIIRNGVEHSQAAEVRYCAQYWPTRDEVEVAILDEGRGIRASLRQNPFLDIQDDAEALRQAIRPGISGVMYEGVPRLPYAPDMNSGFGLYVTSQMCGTLGAFTITSGNRGIKHNQAGTTEVDIGFHGTAICLSIAPSRVAAFGPLRREIVLRGAAEAERTRGVAPGGPSVGTLVGQF